VAFLNDTFTGTDGTNLESHTGETGATWTVEAGGWTTSAKLQSNRVYGNGISRAYYASGIPASADYDVETAIRVVTKATTAGPCGRMSTSADTHYHARISGASPVIQLIKRVAGAETLLGSFTPASPADGSDHTIRLSMRSTALTVYYDGVSVITATDSDITAAGRAGIRLGASTTTGGYHIDSIVAGEPQALAGSSAGAGSQSSALTVAWPLSGSSAGAGTPSANLVVTHPLAGSSAGVGAISAAVTVAWPLAASATGTGDVSGNLVANRPLEGTSAGSGSATGATSVSWTLAGSSAGAGATSATATVAWTLAGQADGGSSTTGDLTEGIYLIGSSSGSGSIAGALSYGAALAGDSTGQGAVTADLVADRPLVGSSDGAGDLTGDLALSRALVGTSTGQGSADSALNARAGDRAVGGRHAVRNFRRRGNAPRPRPYRC
jgi:hypothetical protein